MTQIEMNSYRFLSGEEPSEEMLEQIMREAAEDAVKRRTAAEEAYYDRMLRNIESKMGMWADRIGKLVNDGTTAQA